MKCPKCKSSMWFDINYTMTPFHDNTPLTNIHGMIQCLGLGCYFTYNIEYTFLKIEERKEL